MPAAVVAGAELTVLIAFDPFSFPHAFQNARYWFVRATAEAGYLIACFVTLHVPVLASVPCRPYLSIFAQSIQLGL